MRVLDDRCRFSCRFCHGNRGHILYKEENHTHHQIIQCDTADMTVLALKEKLVLLFADKGIKSPLDIRLLYELSAGIKSLPYTYRRVTETFLRHELMFRG